MDAAGKTGSSGAGDPNGAEYSDLGVAGMHGPALILLGLAPRFAIQVIDRLEEEIAL